MSSNVARSISISNIWTQDYLEAKRQEEEVAGLIQDNIEEETPDELARSFGQIEMDKSYSFIQQHPEIIATEHSDALLGESFELQLKGQKKEAKSAIRQSLIIQYCQQLGPDGVKLFFTRYGRF